MRINQFWCAMVRWIDGLKKIWSIHGSGMGPTMQSSVVAEVASFSYLRWRAYPMEVDWEKKEIKITLTVDCNLVYNDL